MEKKGHQGGYITQVEWTDKWFTDPPKAFTVWFEPPKPKTVGDMGLSELSKKFNDWLEEYAEGIKRNKAGEPMREVRDE